MHKSSDSADFHVIIPASGIGARMGGDIPKQYQMVNGTPILQHTLNVFQNIPECLSILVVIHSDHNALYEGLILKHDKVRMCLGSNERNNSIFNAVKKLAHLKNDDKILVHDAVRPLVSKHDILNVVYALDDYRAATLCTPVFDTTIDADFKTIDRNAHVSCQTPQGFHFGVLKQAHAQTDIKNVTDDAMLVRALGITVHHVQGARSNIKITTPEDMIMAQSLLSAANTPMTTRTGMGFDVHAFETGRTLMLCGVDVPYDKGLKGHSDADVGLHALTDAILGAMGAGDIGRHFPPSDDTFKDMDSAIFLDQTMAMLREKNGHFVNCDVTLICEEPKITPHADPMVKRIAQIIGCRVDCVNVKATTSERLGFTGRGEGIAAQAIATIQLPEGH